MSSASGASAHRTLGGPEFEDFPTSSATERSEEVGRDEEVVAISPWGDPAIPKRMRFGTANKLRLVGVLREQRSLVELGECDRSLHLAKYKSHR